MAKATVTQLKPDNTHTNPLIYDTDAETVENVRDTLAFLMGAMDGIENGPFIGEGAKAASPARGAAFVVQSCLYALGTVEGGKKA